MPINCLHGVALPLGRERFVPIFFRPISDGSFLIDPLVSAERREELSDGASLEPCNPVNIFAAKAAGRPKTILDTTGVGNEYRRFCRCLT